MYMPIKTWAEDDRPREKLLLKGKSSLSDSELLAILIGSGSKNESAVQLCQRILQSSQNNLNELAKLNVTNLCNFKGIGEAKAIAIIAALELGKRRKLEEEKLSEKITCSKDIYAYMQPIVGDLPHEEFWVLYVNNANKVIGKSQLSKGGITGTVVDYRMVFKTALENLATAIVLIHNHPSGLSKPSSSDKKLTNEILEAGKLLKINLIDHVIITNFDYYSFRDDGIF
jgi:DNA repair protein RadC